MEKRFKIKIIKYKFDNDKKYENKVIYYFFIPTGKNNLDVNIIKFLKLEYEEYKKILIKQFNGCIIHKEICFENKKDIKKAVEWIESLIIMNKLVD